MYKHDQSLPGYHYRQPTVSISSRYPDKEAIIPKITCKTGHSITIGEDIVITVGAIINEQVDLDLDMPRDIGLRCEGISFENVLEIADEWFKR